jgi:sulfur relay (sulfurtransferase) complex TusBCD TusD component (DsrE family)
VDARGIKPESLVQGAHQSSLEALTGWMQEADKVLVF